MQRRTADERKSTFLRLHISKIAEPNYHGRPPLPQQPCPHGCSAIAGYDSDPEMISAASSPALARLGGRAQVVLVVV